MSGNYKTLLKSWSSLNEDVNGGEQKWFGFSGKLEMQILLNPGSWQQAYTSHNHFSSEKHAPQASPSPSPLLIGEKKKVLKEFAKRLLKKNKTTNILIWNEAGLILRHEATPCSRVVGFPLGKACWLHALVMFAQSDERSPDCLTTLSTQWLHKPSSEGLEIKLSRTV